MRYRIFMLVFLLPLLVVGQNSDKFCGKKVVGYVPNWSANAFTVNYNDLSHAFFSFLKPEPDGSLIEFEPSQYSILEDFLKRTKAASCKRFISLGGGGDQNFPIMAENPKARQKFIANVIRFCKEKGFDGIDMDWELMDNEQKKKDYTSIMKEFRVACNQNNFQLVSTIGFGNYWCQWIEDEAVQQADWIQLMIYDQTGTWSESPFGNHASFEHFLQAEEYWVNQRKFPREKIVMGVPYYGYRFSSRSGGLGTGVAYIDICKEFSTLKPEDDQTPGEDLTFFNGPVTIRKKTKYVIDKGFAGIMNWEMTQDAEGEKSLHKQVLNELKLNCIK